MIRDHGSGLLSSVATFALLTTIFQGAALASDTIEEVIVTTQKRGQNIRNVPLTITSLDGDLLQKLNMDEFDRLSDLTPGLLVQEQSPNNPAFVIRGITSDSGSPQIAPRVSVYLNGIDVSRSRGSHFELFDIERVEVIKGPQATLFGTAAAIGAVSVITRKPQQDFEGEVSLGYGNFDSLEAKGYVTGGSSTVQGRLAFSYRRRDGYIENIAGDLGSQSEGGTVQPDLNGINRVAVRGSLRLLPTDTLTVDLVLNYEKDDDTGSSFKSGTLAPTGGGTDPFSFAELGGAGPLSADVLGSATLGIVRELYDANLTMDWAAGETWTVTSVTGYRKFDSLEVFDADGSQAIFAEFAEDATGDQFSQEIRTSFAADSLDAFIGIGYFTEDGRVAVPFLTEEGTFLQCAAGLIPGLPCVGPDGTIGSLTAAQGLPPIYYVAQFGNTGTFHTYSAFADVTVAVSERLSATGGLRYAHETRESGAFASLPASVLTGAPLLDFGNVDTAGAVVKEKRSYDALLPRFNLRYALQHDTNLYVTVSKGRRSDVIEVASMTDAGGAPAARTTFVPAEVMWNYETGIKSRLMDGRLDIAASVFYQTYNNFQVTILDPGGVTRQENAGTARNIGAEGEIRALVGEYIQLFGTLAHIDARIDDKAENGVFAGNRFRLQPEWSTALGALVVVPISSSLKLTGNATWTYRSDVFFEIENQPIAGLEIRQGGVHLVNANLGIAATDDRWALTAFASNLLDNNHLIDAGNTGGLFGSPTFIAGPPRFYGLKLTSRF
ncbi:TonB-dependent receptor [Kordiimonas aestuarii]|uniref:TonB-dependent receptor n=1 Tax=Kordiimonas aestuarii TaxID=1005925 RepID=UPI0021D26A6C|nr:TonB-dependent receptor [Kordiimonas aestuarii]